MSSFYFSPWVLCCLLLGKNIQSRIHLDRIFSFHFLVEKFIVGFELIPRQTRFT